MKVAVCLSGMPGNLAFSLEQIQKNIIEPLNADLFIYMWHTNGPVFRNNEPDRFYNKTFVEETINHFVKPTKIKIKSYENIRDIFEDQVKLPIVKHATKILGAKINYFSVWYTVKQANEMKLKYEQENQMKYDIVIKMRTELKFDRTICFNDLQHINKGIIIPLGYGDGGKHKPNLAGINDFMAFGTSKIIDVYSSLYDNILDYCTKTGIVHPETHVLQHLLKYNIPIVRIEFPGKLWKEDMGFPFGNKWKPGPEYPGIALDDKNETDN